MKRKRQFPGATWYRDNTGTRRWRFRKKGTSKELGTEYGSPEFCRRYEEAQALLEGRQIASNQTRPGTINDLIVRYYQIAFAGERLAESTKITYRAMLDRFREEHGHRPAKGMAPYNVEVILARMADRPAAANNLRKRLIPVFAWRSN